MNSSYLYADKDITYLKDQDKLIYYAAYPEIQVYFVDPASTSVEEHRTQNHVGYLDPVTIPVALRFDNLRRFQKKYDLEDIPDAVAIFSVAVLDALENSAQYKVEPDVVIGYFSGVLWKVTNAFRQDFIGSNDDEFLHYECVIERVNETHLGIVSSPDEVLHFGTTSILDEMDFSNTVDTVEMLPYASKVFFALPKTAITSYTDADSGNLVPYSGSYSGSTTLQLTITGTLPDSAGSVTSSDFEITAEDSDFYYFQSLVAYSEKLLLTILANEVP